MKKGYSLILILILVLLITGCGSEISEEDLKEIDISNYTARPSTMISYVFMDEDGLVFNQMEWVILYSDGNRELQHRENSKTSTYVEGHRVTRDEFVLTRTISNIIGITPHDKILLTNKTRQWNYDNVEEELGVCEITELSITVDTSYESFENCLEVTHTRDGKIVRRLYYAPYTGIVAMDDGSGKRLVEIVDYIKLNRFEEKNALYEMHLSGEDYYTDQDDLLIEDYEDSESDSAEYESEDLLDMVMKDDINKIRLAIDRGVDIDKKNEFGITMLMEAARSGYMDIVELLIQNGADPNKQATNTETALLWAVDEEYVEIIEILINAGSEINIKGNFDRTPLWVACSLGNVQIAKLLLENGADPNVKLDNIDGSTPLSLAKDKGLTELVEILERY